MSNQVVKKFLSVLVASALSIPSLVNAAPEKCAGDKNKKCHHNRYPDHHAKKKAHKKIKDSDKPELTPEQKKKDLQKLKEKEEDLSKFTGEMKELMDEYQITDPNQYDQLYNAYVKLFKSGAPSVNQVKNEQAAINTFRKLVTSGISNPQQRAEINKNFKSVSAFEQAYDVRLSDLNKTYSAIINAQNKIPIAWGAGDTQNIKSSLLDLYGDYLKKSGGQNEGLKGAVQALAFGDDGKALTAEQAKQRDQIVSALNAGQSYITDSSGNQIQLSQYLPLNQMKEAQLSYRTTQNNYDTLSSYLSQHFTNNNPDMTAGDVKMIMQYLQVKAARDFTQQSVTKPTIDMTSRLTGLGRLSTKTRYNQDFDDRSTGEADTGPYRGQINQENFSVLLAQLKEDATNKAQLLDTQVQGEITNRATTLTGKAKDQFLKNYNALNVDVNYDSIIEAEKDLAQSKDTDGVYKTKLDAKYDQLRKDNPDAAKLTDDFMNQKILDEHGRQHHNKYDRRLRKSLPITIDQDIHHFAASACGTDSACYAQAKNFFTPEKRKQVGDEGYAAELMFNHVRVSTLIGQASHHDRGKSAREREKAFGSIGDDFSIDWDFSSNKSLRNSAQATLAGFSLMGVGELGGEGSDIELDSDFSGAEMTEPGIIADSALVAETEPMTAEAQIKEGLPSDFVENEANKNDANKNKKRITFEKNAPRVIEYDSESAVTPDYTTSENTLPEPNKPAIRRTPSAPPSEELMPIDSHPSEHIREIQSWKASGKFTPEQEERLNRLSTQVNKYTLSDETVNKLQANQETLRTQIDDFNNRIKNLTNEVKLGDASNEQLYEMEQQIDTLRSSLDSTQQRLDNERSHLNAHEQFSKLENTIDEARGNTRKINMRQRILSEAPEGYFDTSEISDSEHFSNQENRLEREELRTKITNKRYDLIDEKRVLKGQLSDQAKESEGGSRRGLPKADRVVLEKIDQINQDIDQINDQLSELKNANLSGEKTLTQKMNADRYARGELQDYSRTDSAMERHDAYVEGFENYVRENPHIINDPVFNEVLSEEIDTIDRLTAHLDSDPVREQASQRGRENELDERVKTLNSRSERLRSLSADSPERRYGLLSDQVDGLFQERQSIENELSLEPTTERDISTRDYIREQRISLEEKASKLPEGSSQRDTYEQRIQRLATREGALTEAIEKQSPNYESRARNINQQIEEKQRSLIKLVGQQDALNGVEMPSEDTMQIHRADPESVSDYVHKKLLGQTAVTTPELDTVDERTKATLERRMEPWRKSYRTTLMDSAKAYNADPTEETLNRVKTAVKSAYDAEVNTGLSYENRTQSLINDFSGITDENDALIRLNDPSASYARAADLSQQMRDLEAFELPVPQSLLEAQPDAASYNFDTRVNAVNTYMMENPGRVSSRVRFYANELANLQDDHLARLNTIQEKLSDFSEALQPALDNGLYAYDVQRQQPVAHRTEEVEHNTSKKLKSMQERARMRSNLEKEKRDRLVRNNRALKSQLSAQ